MYTIAGEHICLFLQADSSSCLTPPVCGHHSLHPVVFDLHMSPQKRFNLSHFIQYERITSEVYRDESMSKENTHVNYNWIIHSII